MHVMDASSPPSRDGPPPRAERLRARLRVFGSDGLGDDELLALVVGGRGGLDRARRLLQDTGGLRAVATAPPDELVRAAGLGRAAAARLAAAFELGRRAACERAVPPGPITCPADAERILAPLCAARDREHFVACGLDARHRVRLVHTVAVGTLSYVDVHPREVFRPLVRAGAYAAIVAHNHPSGDPTPSDEDVRLTERLCEAGALLGIELLDHLVFAGGRAVSLRASGRVGPPSAARAPSSVWERATLHRATPPAKQARAACNT